MAEQRFRPKKARDDRGKGAVTSEGRKQIEDAIAAIAPSIAVSLQEQMIARAILIAENVKDDDPQEIIVRSTSKPPFWEITTARV